MFTRFLKTAISTSNSIYKSNLRTCIIDMENVEPFIFGDALLNFVWFETFARTPFFDFGHFQTIFTQKKCLKKEDLGTDECWLHSRNDATGPEEATTWKYVPLNENDEWMPTFLDLHVCINFHTIIIFSFIV